MDDIMQWVDYLINQLQDQSGHIAKLEGASAVHFSNQRRLVAQAEEHLRQALIILEEAAA